MRAIGPCPPWHGLLMSQTPPGDRANPSQTPARTTLNGCRRLDCAHGKDSLFSQGLITFGARLAKSQDASWHIENRRGGGSTMIADPLTVSLATDLMRNNHG